MEVGVGDDHALADLAKGQTEVIHDGGLSLARQGAGHEDAVERHLLGKQLDLDAQAPDRVQEQDGREK